MNLDFLSNIDMNTVIEVIRTGAYIVLGGLAIWFKTSSAAQKKLKEISSTAVTLIKEAEDLFRSTTTNGSDKFNTVVCKLYDLVPTPLRLIITKSIIEDIVQSTFDEMKKYASTKLDEAVEHIPNLSSENCKVYVNKTTDNTDALNTEFDNNTTKVLDTELDNTTSEYAPHDGK